MPNALNQRGVVGSYYAGQDDAAAQTQQNALAQQRQTMFDQSQQDRSRSMLREDGLAFYAGITQAQPEQRAQLYTQWRQPFVSQYPEAAQILPEQYDDASFGQIGFRLLPPEIAQKIVAERYSPKAPLEVSPGATLVDPRTNKPIYTAPNRPLASADRLVPVADPDSPTGYTYIPQPDAANRPAPAPRAGDKARLPATLQKEEDSDLEIINAASGIKADLGSIAAQVRGGSLNLGPVENIKSGALNWAGASTQNSRNFASMKSTLERLRNESLRLNKGVQTEGDAIRAWNELLANINDEALVTQRLEEIQRLNDRAVTLRQGLIENRRKDYSSRAPDTSSFQNTPPTVGVTAQPQKKYVRTGTRNGKRVGELPDGTVEEIPGG